MEMGQIEVCEPRSVQVWRGFVSWVGFILQVFIQILRGTPSFFSYLVGLSSSSYSSLLASSSSSASPSFKPLPVVELPLQESSAAAAAHVSFDGGLSDDCGGGGDGQEIEKLTVVLDLDETLVCAYETSSLPAIIRAQAAEAGLKLFELECVSSDKECDGKPKINYVTVFERPGLHEFLKKLAEFADLVLFTAGLEGYARPLVDKIDRENLFSLRLYRPSTVSTEYREHVKDLSCLSKDLCRVVLVDNNPFSFLLQPLNGIPCIPFSTGQPYDNQLLEVLLPLLNHLSLQKDVRPVLHESAIQADLFGSAFAITNGDSEQFNEKLNTY
ncbi:FCP1 domain-containing protein [Citrus sinensis]|nr:FCP1 domain-containing protein [Citrus sinensis]